MELSFRALVTEETESGEFIRSIKTKHKEDLPAGEVIVKVQYSSLNYKDALSASGHKGITRKFPHTPGIDAAGVVVESATDLFSEGDEVIVTGHDLGMNTDGGFAEYIRVPAYWVVRKPDTISIRKAMIYGTAGFTAATGISEIQKCGITPDMGPVLVTGATGGVGTMAVAILNKLGYHVIASTGKESSHDFLKKLGAKEIIHRSEVNDQSGKGLLPKRWIAAIDNVGGNTLSTILRATSDRGVVTNCGMVESTKLDTFVFPFILRGVRLIGIASAETPLQQRLMLWDKISTEYLLDNTDFFVKEVSLDQVSTEIDLILSGGQTGRVLVKM